MAYVTLDMWMMDEWDPLFRTSYFIAGLSCKFIPYHMASEQQVD